MKDRRKKNFRWVIYLVTVAIILAIGYYAAADKVEIRRIKSEENLSELGTNYRIISNASAESFTDADRFRAQSPKTVVMFYSTWCGNCVFLQSTLRKESKVPLYRNIKFYEIDIDQNRDLANVFDIQQVPALVFIDDASIVVDEKFGEEDLKDKVEVFYYNGTFNL